MRGRYKLFSMRNYIYRYLSFSITVSSQVFYRHLYHLRVCVCDDRVYSRVHACVSQLRH